MTEPTREREARIPRAEFAYPTCGACEAETYHDGDGLRCDECKLGFDSTSMEASLLYDDEPQCGKPCSNTWHADHAITPGRGYDCYPCALTEGHTSLHFTGCRSKALASNEGETKT